MQIVFLIFLFILGSCLGSFLCCQARRLRLKYSKHKHLGNRSVCLHCHHRLKWYDNLPIISWLLLKGKCRKCHKPIGASELLSETGTAIAFLGIGTTINISTASPLEWAIFCAVLLFTSVLIFLSIYDGAYGELPTHVLIISIICAIIVLVLSEILTLSNYPFTPKLILQPISSILILGGLYLLLYLISKGRWVGDGDWILGTSIGIAIIDPWLALIILFLSNTFACLVGYPATKSKKTKKIHFGPFLVTAFIVVYTFSDIFYMLLSL